MVLKLATHAVGPCRRKTMPLSFRQDKSNKKDKTFVLLQSRQNWEGLSINNAVRKRKSCSACWVKFGSYFYLSDKTTYNYRLVFNENTAAYTKHNRRFLRVQAPLPRIWPTNWLDHPNMRSLWRTHEANHEKLREKFHCKIPFKIEGSHKNAKRECLISRACSTLTRFAFTARCGKNTQNHASYMQR